MVGWSMSTGDTTDVIAVAGVLSDGWVDVKRSMVTLVAP